MKKTSYTSECIREMLQTAVGKMIPVFHLVLLFCVSKHVAGIAPTGYLGDIYEKLGVAEQIINSTKKELPTNCHPQLPMDCEDLLNKGEKRSGIYLVRPKNRVISGSIPVYCDMDTDGGGWTVIQRRGNFSRSKDYFYQDWQAYKKGFGKLEEDFWLGNDYIYALSNQKPYSVRFDLEDAKVEKRFATYDAFWIEEEGNNYTLHVTGYNGDAGDSFTYHNGCKFSTKNRDNDISEDNCAEYSKAAWWYKDCQRSGLNGEYLVGETEKKGEGLVWYDWKGKSESLAATEIKLRSSHVICEKTIPAET